MPASARAGSRRSPSSRLPEAERGRLVARRQQSCIPLGLPSAPEDAGLVARRVAEFARTYADGRPVALLDIDNGNPVLRAAVEAAIGAERCAWFDTRAVWPAEVFRWEISEPGKLFASFAFVIALTPIATYLSALRTVYDRFPGRPPVVLPYAQTGETRPAPPVTIDVSLGDDSPVVFVFPPNCGTNRLEPVVRALLTWVEKRRVQGIHAAGHRRLVAGIDAPRYVYAENRQIRQALHDCYAHFISLMDVDSWCDLHDHVGADVLAEASFCRFVALYRDPRDYINSMYHWFCDPRHGAQFGSLPSMPKDEGMLMLFEGFSDRSPTGDGVSEVPSLANVARNFVALRRHPNILPVSYEEARLDPRPLYRRMLTWLGADDVVFKPIPDATLDEVISFGSFSVQSGGMHQEGRAEGYYKEATHGRSALRKGVVGDWKNHFSPRVKERAKELVGEALIELGYEKDMNW
jgi:hypothetical protein